MATWLEPLAAQVTGIRLDDATIAAVVRVLDEPSAPALGRAPPPDALRAAASGVPRDFAAGKLDVAAFTAAIADLTAEEEALDQGEAPTPTVTAAEATGLPRNLPQLWAEAGREGAGGSASRHPPGDRAARRHVCRRSPDSRG